MSRALVTGIGAVTPVGLTAPESWQNLLAGVSGIGPIQAFDPSDLPVRIAGEVTDFSPTTIDSKEARRMSRFAQFCVTAAQEAAKDAGLELSDEERPRAATAIATGAGGVLNTFLETEAYIAKGPARVSPFFVPLMAPNMGACQVGMQLGLRGPTLASTAACASGLYSYIEAKALIESGLADVVIAGGGEAALHPVSVAGLANMKALSRRNDNPEGASRPFDRDRDGFVFGEGASVFVVESEERARKRGARVYAEIAGGALSSDAYHITAPRDDGSGAAQAMTSAMRAAECGPEEIDCISAHGTGTPLNDVSETLAIKLAFGDHANSLAISATKSMVGHLLGGAGAVGAMASVLSIATGLVPPTINLEHADPECDLDYIPGEAREISVKAAMVNGFGFGGQNGSVVFRHYQA
ncbi:MAG TPA: beta-ketoacyl-[acyl-carrier-protein] synthase II [Dehalococcoidia bacterium]|nr:beta-ketoacyl-[acyl-carrier-protein] synthase II [Dehalococcoidia bacterium]